MNIDGDMDVNGVATVVDAAEGTPRARCVNGGDPVHVHVAVKVDVDVDSSQHPRPADE